MTDHSSKKCLFISHASSDAEFANAVKAEVEKVFANGVDVFCTSSPGAIPAGKDWLKEIETRLDGAQAVIAIVTPVSIERPWLWFEIGATWARRRADTVEIYPLCAAEIDLSDLPPPLDRLQALSLKQAPHLKILFQSLIQQFGFGKISSFKASNIIRRVPKYKDVVVKPADLNARRFYSGKYSGYSDEELMEIIDTKIMYPDDKDLISPGREGRIRNGKLVHFREVDDALELPPGTAVRLLVPVAARYSLFPSYRTDNVIRFKPHKKAAAP